MMKLLSLLVVLACLCVSVTLAWGDARDKPANMASSLVDEELLCLGKSLLSCGDCCSYYHMGYSKFDLINTDSCICVPK